MSNRLNLLALLVIGALACRVAAAEAPKDIESGLTPTAIEEWREGYRTKLKEQNDQEGKKYVDRMKEENDQINEPGAAVVYVDGKELAVKEPTKPKEAIGRDTVPYMWKAKPEDFEMIIHEIYEVNIEDLRLPMEPVEVVFREKANTDTARFLVPYTLTNSTSKPRRFGLRVWIVTGDLKFTPEVGGWIHKAALERSALDFKTMGRAAKWQSTFELIGYKPEDGEPVATFRPGETRYGVAVFPRFDQEMDEMKVVFEGLNNVYKFGRRLKRVLVFEYRRPGDEFYPQREKLRLVDKHWEWMWMWDADIKIGRPSKAVITTPAGRTKTLWHYQYSLKNSTKSKRTIDLRSFNTVVRMDLDVGGQTFKDVEVEIEDDGDSTIHKSQAIIHVVGEAFVPRRFFKGTLEPNETKEGLVIFDVDDVLYDAVFQQLEWGINKKMGVDYVERALKEDNMQGLQIRPADVNRRHKKLTDAQKASIRKQIHDNLDQRLGEEQQQKRILAKVTARAGVSTGTRRINRYYIKRGIIEEDWIHQWEEEE